MIYSQMTNEQLVEEFYQIWKESNVVKSNINVYVRNHYNELYKEIEKRTISLNKYKRFKQCKNKKILCDISIFERIYCLMHHLNDRPLCKVCGKNTVGFSVSTTSYGDYCSHACQHKSSICIAKQIATKEKKYGKGNITNSKKAHQTRLAKYGSHHPTDYAQKVKATKLKNHGDENYVNVDKMLVTVQKRIEDNPNYYYDREQKTKQTKIANGHDPNWNNRQKFKKTLSTFTDERKQEIKDKRRQTCYDNYGCEFPTQSQEVKDKTVHTNIQNYGVKSTFNLQKSRTNMQQAIRQKAWDDFQSGNFEIQPLIDEVDFISNESLNLKKDLIKWKCKKCGHEFEHTWSNWKRKCPKCYPQNYRGMQTEVEEFVKSLCVGHEVRRDCKNVLNDARQLDIYVPSIAFAIEFNGCFWHNSDKCVYGRSPTPMMYHYKKSIECAEKGIRLVHMFEDEWRFNSKLCKSKLKKLLCPNSVMHIDGRNCQTAKAIDSNAKHRMLCKYTFDGDDGSSVQYGLMHKGHLIAMMTFSRTKNNKQYEWQILNYVEMNAFIIDNGFETLLSSFIADFCPKSISMYSSYDWTTKEDYISLFDNAYINAPRLYWTHEGHRVKGSSITSKNVQSIIQEYDGTKSFLQNMNDNGYLRIYDSGTIVFEKRF